VRKARLFIALHMQAGDGNIPVHSADDAMLKDADMLADHCRICHKSLSPYGLSRASTSPMPRPRGCN
jgi:FAD/FMN-containing dehydrogenase